MNGLKGVWTALISPFGSSDQLDLPAYRKLIETQIKGGVVGIIPCGTTGESPTLTQEEKKTLIKTALEVTEGTPVQVAAGTGSNNTKESVEFSKWASDQGVAGVLVVTPYYNKPSQAGLIDHFTAIADAVKTEVILYNVPGRTSVSLTPQTIATLAKHEHINTIKEATADMSFASAIRTELKESGQQMSLLSGDDPTFLAFLGVGGSGAVSVASNIIPKTMVDIGKNNPKSLQLHEEYFPLFRDLFVECNPVPIKHALARVGIGNGRVRLPLAPLREHSQAKLEGTLRLLKLLK